jgi:hypothetical protein
VDVYPYPQPTGHGPQVMVGMGFFRGHLTKIHLFNYLPNYNYQTTLQAGAHRCGVGPEKRKKKLKKKQSRRHASPGPEKRKKGKYPGDRCLLGLGVVSSRLVVVILPLFIVVVPPGCCCPPLLSSSLSPPRCHHYPLSHHCPPSLHHCCPPSLHSHCPPSLWCRQSTCDPPHKQLLVRLGVGGVLHHQSSPCVIVVPCHCSFVVEHP